jgi:hypothetical protein
MLIYSILNLYIFIISAVSNNIFLHRYELAQARVKQGKYLLAEDELRKKEESYGQERSDIAAQRLVKEKCHSDLAQKERQSYDNELIQAKKALQERQHHERAEAKKSHEKANKYYKKTMNRLKKVASDESNRAGIETEKRIDTLLKLKGDITSNRVCESCPLGYRLS